MFRTDEINYPRHIETNRIAGRLAGEPRAIIAQAAVAVDGAVFKQPLPLRLRRQAQPSPSWARAMS